MSTFCFRRDNYITNKMRVVSLTHNMPTCPPLHPYQILSNIIKLSQTVWPAQDFGFRGDNYITKKVKFSLFSLARNMPTGPPLHCYQILSKYFKGYQSYREHKDASTDRQMDAMLIAIFQEPIGRGIKIKCLN